MGTLVSHKKRVSRSCPKGPTTTPVRHSVFICHSHVTTSLAKELSVALRAQGVSTWLDRENLSPASFRTPSEIIGEAIRRASAVIFLINPKPEAGPWVRWEWSMALEAAWEQPSKVLIPLLLGDAKPPPFLGDRIALRLVQEPRDLDAVARKIAAALAGKAGLGGIDKRGQARERARRAVRFRELGLQLAAWKKAQNLGRAPV